MPGRSNHGLRAGRRTAQSGRETRPARTTDAAVDVVPKNPDAFPPQHLQRLLRFPVARGVVDDNELERLRLADRVHGLADEPAVAVTRNDDRDARCHRHAR
jgi:hypothetical protein